MERRSLMLSVMGITMQKFKNSNNCVSNLRLNEQFIQTHAGFSYTTIEGWLHYNTSIKW